MSDLTITLEGSEVRADFFGTNAWLRNDGTSTIYAGRKPGVVSGADGVVSVPAGSSAPVFDAHGTVYIIGAGSVQLIGSDYSNNPFKTSAQGGSGADEVARAAIEAHAGNSAIHLTAEQINSIEGGKTVEKSSSYTLDNAVDYPIVDMRIYGKSTQDGTPTPENPVDIVSVESPVVTIGNGTDSVSAALPYTLCGVPVDSDGNYTDSTGQQWIADELVYNADGTGKIVKRTKKIVADGINIRANLMLERDGITQFHMGIDSTLADGTIINNSYCSHLPYKYHIDMTYTHFFVFDDNGNIYVRCYADSSVVGTNGTEINAWLASQNEAGTPFTVVAALKTPQEISLTTAEMAQLEALQTFDGVTNISNDGGAEMSVKYCTNKALSEYEKPVIDGLKKQINELKTAVLSLGGNV